MDPTHGGVMHRYDMITSIRGAGIVLKLGGTRLTAWGSDDRATRGALGSGEGVSPSPVFHVKSVLKGAFQIINS